MTASFENVSEEHDGDAVLALDVRFSEALGDGGAGPTVTSFDVRAGKSDGGRGSWRRLVAVQVKPGSWRDVAVTLAGGRDCGAVGPVCTADGRAPFAGGGRLGWPLGGRGGASALHPRSDHDTFDLGDGDGVRRAVVELRRLRRGMPRDLLRVLQRPPVRQVRRDPRRPERVAARRRRQPSGRESDPVALDGRDQLDAGTSPRGPRSTPRRIAAAEGGRPS